MAHQASFAGSKRNLGVKLLLEVVRHTTLTLVAITCMVPFIWMISTSFKTSAQIFTFPPEIIPSPAVLSAYIKVLTEVPLPRYLANSLFVTIVIVVGQLVCNVMAAYAFARIPFRGRDAVFMAYLGTMMIPGHVTLVPGFILMDYLGWVDTYYALTVPFMFGSAFGTFLLRQFFLTVPRDLEDAARIDGCGYFRVLWTVHLPLIKPALATHAVFSFMTFWNEFLWPLIVTNSDDKRVLTVGLTALASGYLGTDWATLMAGTVISIVPILTIFIFAQRFFIEGITLSGLKA